MSDATTVTLEQIIEALMNGSPASCTGACLDIAWIIQNDEEHRSIMHWAAECLKDGAKAKKRSIEYAIATRAAKQAAKDAEANLSKFTNALVMNPSILKTAREGDLNLLLKCAASLQIPTNVVLNFLDQVKQSAPATATADSAAA